MTWFSSFYSHIYPLVVMTMQDPPLLYGGNGNYCKAYTPHDDWRARSPPPRQDEDPSLLFGGNGNYYEVYAPHDDWRCGVGRNRASSPVSTIGTITNKEEYLFIDYINPRASSSTTTIHPSTPSTGSKAGLLRLRERLSVTKVSIPSHLFLPCLYLDSPTIFAITSYLLSLACRVLPGFAKT